VTANATQTLVRSAERNAILSSCCGVLGEVALTDSAVILLFAGMLGAGARLSLMTTSLLPLLNGLCIVPMAALAARVGARHLTLVASAFAGVAYFAAAAAPWFGHPAATVLLVSIFCFSLFLSGFVAGWFPLLDTFLARERRVAFFARLRLCHQAVCVTFLFAVGLLIGRHPQVGHVQAVLFASAAIFLGRMAFVSRIPVFPEVESGGVGLRWGLTSAVSNRRLAGFSL
jgi:MFS family permease